MYDFTVNLGGRMRVSVIADNREDAERILKDTMESISLKSIREKDCNNKNVEIKSSNIILDLYDRNKEREAER